MSAWGEAAKYLTGAVGAITAGGVWWQRRSRRVDAAEAGKMRAEARKLDAESSTVEVTVARELVAVVREDMTAQRAYLQSRIDEQAGRIDEQTTRLDRMAQLAEAHAVWDTQVVGLLRQQDPAFPPPPPLA